MAEEVTKYQQWSGGFVVCIIMAALGIGFVGAVIAAHQEQKRADYWREVALDLADKTNMDVAVIRELVEHER